MKTKTLSPLVLFGWLGLWLTTSAALEFEKPLQHLEIQRGVEKVTVHYKYTNTGNRKERIRDIETSCGCLKAHASQRVVREGESGLIEAVFNVGGLAGTVEKSITVVTSFGEPQRLTVRVTIPLLIEIEPKMVKWDVNEVPGPKRARVTMRGTEPIHIKSVDSSRSNVSASIHEIEKGRIYEIEMVPTSTEEIMLGVVRFETDAREKAQARQMAFFRIDRPEEDDAL